jgi:uncharacterized protein (TIGR00251 family)
VALPDYVTTSKDAVLIDVFVQPRAAKDALVGVHGRALKLKVKAPPVDDRANAAVVKFFATALGVPKGRVALVSGHSSRHKRLAVEGVSPELVVDAIERVLSCRAL